MKLVSGDTMSKIDKWSIENIGIPGCVLMENAGRGVFNLFIEKFNPDINSKIVIFAGKGNNGGDGFVLGRYLFNNNFKNFDTILLANSETLKGDAAINFNICKNMGINIKEILNIEQFNSFFAGKSYDFIFDAIFGTGLKSEVKDFYKYIIDFINASSSKKIAIDIPSGLDSEKGIPLGAAVRADLTVTFGIKKIGLATSPGAIYTGLTEVVDISIPKSLPFTISDFEIDDQMVNRIYKKRSVDAHKGSFGHVVILGGSLGFSGAVTLAAKSALKSGSGLVTAILPNEINSIFEASFIEGMSFPIDLKSPKIDKILDFINSKDVIVVGPGLGQSDDAKNLIFKIIEKISIPIIIDADGLNIISEKIDILKSLEGRTIITPHPGEFGRLMNLSSKDIQLDRLSAVRVFLKKYDITLMLKGFRTIICSNGETYISPKGSSAMATAGSGDVLSGIVASFVAQGYSLKDAAVMGAYIHGFSGDIAAKREFPETVTAQSIIDNLHYAFKILFS